MTQYYIQTQILENDGCECGSGKFADNEHNWKFKFGNEFIISGVDRIQDAVAYVASITMKNKIHTKEFPVSFEAVDDDFQTPHEKDQMELNGFIRYPAERINVTLQFMGEGV